MKVKFKRTHSDAVIPIQTLGNAGMDMTCIKIEETADYIEYDTCIAAEIPEGYVGLIFPRSSNSKYDLLLCNSVGVVDSSYRGTIRFRFKNILRISNAGWADPNLYQIGDRVGQLIIMPYPTIESIEVNELSVTDRGDKGFGSTGK